MAQLIGKVLQKLPVVSGETEKGEWFRGGFVVGEQEDLTRVVAFTLFGADRVAMLENLELGDTVIVNYRPESREYGMRWYTDLMCTGISVPRKIQGNGIGAEN